MAALASGSGRESLPWLAESIRFTILSGALGRPVPLFKNISGTDPDEQVSRPAQGQLNEVGIFKGYRVTVLQQVGRMDVIIADDPAANTFDLTRPGYKQFFNVGLYDRASVFAQMLGGALFDQINALHLQGTITRVAFAPTLLRPVPSILEGNRELAKLLPHVNFDIFTDRDIFWQITRPRKSRIDGLQVNRLSKWQVLVIRAMDLTANLAISNLVAFPEKVAVRAELDFIIEMAGQPSEILHPHFEELYRFAEEVARDGDVA